jgi:hypothetical protein
VDSRPSVAVADRQGGDACGGIGPVAEPIADGAAGGDVEESDWQRAEAERGHETGVVGRPRRQHAVDAEAGTHRVGEAGQPGQQTAGGGDMDEAGIDARRAHGVERAGEAGELDLAVRLVLTGNGEMRVRRRQSQAGAPGDVQGESCRVGGIDALPAQSAVDLEMDPHPAPGLQRRHVHR